MQLRNGGMKMQLRMSTGRRCKCACSEDDLFDSTALSHATHARSRVCDKVFTKSKHWRKKTLNDKEAQMHDAFMWIGIRTTSDQSSDKGYCIPRAHELSSALGHSTHCWAEDKHCVLEFLHNFDHIWKTFWHHVSRHVSRVSAFTFTGCESQ